MFIRWYHAWNEIHSCRFHIDRIIFRCEPSIRRSRRQWKYRIHDDTVPDAWHSWRSSHSEHRNSVSFIFKDNGGKYLMFCDWSRNRCPKLGKNLSCHLRELCGVVVTSKRSPSLYSWVRSRISLSKFLRGRLRILEIHEVTPRYVRLELLFRCRFARARKKDLENLCGGIVSHRLGLSYMYFAEPLHSKTP
jgi:hypothetical protein